MGVPAKYDDPGMDEPCQCFGCRKFRARIKIARLKVELASAIVTRKGGDGTAPGAQRVERGPRSGDAL